MVKYSIESVKLSVLEKRLQLLWLIEVILQTYTVFL